MFMCRLALAFGRTLSELSSTLSPSELAIWRAYYRLEPWGDHLNHTQTAQTNWFLWAALRALGALDGPDDRSLKDFFPYVPR